MAGSPSTFRQSRCEKQLASRGNSGRVIFHSPAVFKRQWLHNQWTNCAQGVCQQWFCYCPCLQFEISKLKIILPFYYVAVLTFNIKWFSAGSHELSAILLILIIVPSFIDMYLLLSSATSVFIPSIYFVVIDMETIGYIFVPCASIRPFLLCITHCLLLFWCFCTVNIYLTGLSVWFTINRHHELIGIFFILILLDSWTTRLLCLRIWLNSFVTLRSCSTGCTEKIV